jgi:flagellar hook protein FlgE
MPFRIALSGLNAAQTDLSVTANNIANTSTNGFKGSRAEFADLFAVSLQGVSSNATGNGVRVAAVAQQFAQGNVEFTDSNLDLAVSGSGMFIVNDGGALALHARRRLPVESRRLCRQLAAAAPAGLSTARGRRFQHRRSRRLAPADHRLGAFGHHQCRIPAESARERHTARARARSIRPIRPLSTRRLRSRLFDSLGATHTGTMYFDKTVNANEWNARLYIDGASVGGPQTLQYSNSGLLTAPVGGLLPFPAYTPTTGAAPMSIEVDLSQSTQYGSNFSVNAVTQDGFTTGRLIGIDINETGIVQARFTNGISQPLGQIAIANFANVQGLQQLGNTQWAETFASGQALRGQAGNSGFGLVQSGALEGANVDVTEQLVNMITAQRNFQANAQMISTADSITQTIINMR